MTTGEAALDTLSQDKLCIRLRPGSRVASAPRRRSVPLLCGGAAAFEAALKANNVPYEAFVYDGANHGFHNDTTPRYDEAAAKLAWQRTIDFFNKDLRTGV